MYDPIQVPVYDSDCGWTISLFEYDEDGQPMEGDLDGNWDCCGEIPELDVVDAAWAEYNASVVETGEDPLGNFMVPRTRKVKQVWQFQYRWEIRTGLLGLRFVGARRNSRGPWLTADLPQQVKTFLLVEEGDISGEWWCPRFKSLESLREKAKDITWQRSAWDTLKGKTTLKVNVNRGEKTVQRELRAAARAS